MPRKRERLGGPLRRVYRSNANALERAFGGSQGRLRLSARSAALQGVKTGVHAAGFDRTYVFSKNACVGGMTEHPAKCTLVGPGFNAKNRVLMHPQSVDKVSGQLLLCKNANRSCIAGRSVVPLKLKNLGNTIKSVQADDMCVSLDTLHAGLLRQACMRKIVDKPLRGLSTA